jgi:pimeloyl-ACP methyl ester carboxylesterase
VPASRAVKPLVVLLPSPLLGPSVWEPVAERLAAAGHDVQVPVLPDRRRSPDDVLAALLGALPVDRDLVLVPHSGAGAYVATLAATRRVVRVVFVDAVLPSLDGPTPTAPPGALDHLAGLADGDGRLPGWTSWWPEEDVAALFPDAGSRARVEAEQPQLPLAYFRAAVPAPPGWDLLPCAYLAFGRTYALELARAEASGWPVVVLAGGHLHQLVDPDAVTAELEQLLGE